MKFLIKINDCNIPGAWYQNHIGETFSAYRNITYLNEYAYMVVASDGYSNIVLHRDCEIIDD